MLRQSEHLQCRRRQALAIFSFIVIFYIDFSCADKPKNNAEDTAIPVTDEDPLELLEEIHNTTANQKSPEKPVVSDNNGGAVQSDDVQPDSGPFQYMQSKLANRRIGNFYRFGGSG